MYIRRVAVRQPYIVQTTASVLFDAIAQEKTAEERYHLAGTILQHRIDAYFDDLWRYLQPAAQTAMVILALAEMKGHVDKRNFNTSDLGECGNFAVSHGNRWRISAGCFVWWVADNAIAGTKEALNFEQWLHDREFEGLLTRGEKDKIKELAGKIPKSAVNSAGKFIGTFLKGLLTGKG